MITQTDAKDKATNLGRMRGKGLIARNAVVPDGDSFLIALYSLRNSGRKMEIHVGRNESGRFVCSCAEFEHEAVASEDFACEHIYAVRLWQQQHAGPGDIRLNSDDQAQMQGQAKGKAMMRMKEVETKLNGDERQATRTVPHTTESTQNDFSSVLHLLRQPVDEKLIRVREGWTDRAGRKHPVEYIEWHTVADLLDRICPLWSHCVKSITEINGMVAVVASLTIGGITREGVGTGTGDTETGIKKAEHDALKRAAVKFGIARELYQKEGDMTEGGVVVTRLHRDRSSLPYQSSDTSSTDARAKGMNDLVTAKQLGMIRHLAHEAQVDAEAECQQMYECKPEDLNKRAASKLIETLMNRVGAKSRNVARAS